MQGRCSKCGRAINFVRTPAGKMMPIETASACMIPDPSGRMLAVTVGGKLIRGNRAVPGERGSITVYIPHWISCPYSTQESSRRKKPFPYKKKASEMKKKETPVKEERPVAEQLKLFYPGRTGTGF